MIVHSQWTCAFSFLKGNPSWNNPASWGNKPLHPSEHILAGFLPAFLAWYIVWLVLNSCHCPELSKILKPGCLCLWWFFIYITVNTNIFRMLCKYHMVSPPFAVLIFHVKSTVQGTTRWSCSCDVPDLFQALTPPATRHPRVYHQPRSTCWAPMLY